MSDFPDPGATTAGRRRIPLSAPVLGGNEAAYLQECIDTGWVSSAGPFVGRFEDTVREVTGSGHAVACQSGTAALHVALLLAGLGRGDGVIVPTITFVATANAVAYTGATPIFMDCDEHLNIDADKTRAFLEEECVREDGRVAHSATGTVVRAIVPVHVFGNPCKMDLIAAIGDEWGLAVIEDAAESLGSKWVEGPLAGRHTGTVGVSSALSFNGNKICTSGGGGMLLTEDGDLAARARHLVDQAKSDPVRYVHDEVGYNYRLTNLHAAVGLAQLERLEEFIASRTRIHGLYREAFSRSTRVNLLEAPSGTRANHWLSVVLIEPHGGVDRETVMSALTAEGIESRPVWVPNHMQAPYADTPAYRIERAPQLWERALDLPSTSDLSDIEVERVASTVLGAVGN